MVTIHVDLPESLHAAVRDAVESEGVSINQFISLAVAEKIAALRTADYLEARAKRGDRTKFLSAMAKVADTEPENEADRLLSS